MGIAAGLRGAGQQQLLFLYMLRASAVNQQNAAVSVRLARREDIPGIQSCNLKTLPENYATQFYVQHLHTWPQLAIVAEATISSLGDVGGGNERGIDELPYGTLEHDASAHDHQKMKNNNNHDNNHEKRLAKMGFRGRVGRGAAMALEHATGFPQKKVVGYVLGRMDTTPGATRPTRAGHITSLAVLPSFRRRGIAQDLMKMVHDEVGHSNQL